MGRNESMAKLLIKIWEGKEKYLDNLPNKNRVFTLSSGEEVLELRSGIFDMV